MSEFWVGDFVLIKSKGLYGRYHKDGSNNTCLVKTEKGIILTNLSDLEVTDEPINDSTPKVSKQNKKAQQTINRPKKEIDLHLDILDPERRISQHRMLDYQLDACRNFLNEALTAKYRTVLIIHGKGSGILKQEVKHLLKMSDLVDYSFDKNDGGATEVWLKFNSVN